MSPSKLMKAAVMHERGDSHVLKYEDFPMPTPGRGEVLIRVRVATVNHTDIFHRTGKFFIQKELPHILGMDVAGEIAAVGPEVKTWTIGDRVVATFEALGRERNGAYAEFTTVPENQLRKIPEGLNSKGAASIGLAFTTAWVALFNTGSLGSHESVVIHAASSGVGTAAIQIAKWKKAQVIAISEPAKFETLRKLGANHLIDRNHPKIAEEVLKLTNGKGAGLVLELVGKTTLQTSISMLAQNGRIVCVGTLSGDVAEMNVMDLIMKAGTIKGSFGVISKTDFETILGLFANGTFQPVIDTTFPLSQAAEAHDRVESGKALGKVLLKP